MITINCISPVTIHIKNLLKISCLLNIRNFPRGCCVTTREDIFQTTIIQFNSF
jgi:hypothetical protein